MPKQLPLPFAEIPAFAAADFVVAPSNETAWEFLARPESWTNSRLILWGEAGCGKSHLAHIWAEARGGVLWGGAALHGSPPPPTGPVAIDDVDTAPDEAAVLHLINLAAEAGRPVLLTAQSPPARLNIALPDLASRLRASLTVEVLPPDDELLAALLCRLVADRQLVLNLQVRHFLLTRLPRTPAALREAVARLDRAALAAGGKITRTLAAALLADLQTPETKNFL